MPAQVTSDSSLEFQLIPETGSDVVGTRSPKAGNDVLAVDLTSDAPLPVFADPTFGDASLAIPLDLQPTGPRPGSSMWMEGDVLICACPDCRAPMSVRLWLMVADCWKCGTSIELSEEQEREAQRLLASRARSRGEASAAAPAGAAPATPDPVTAVRDSAMPGTPKPATSAPAPAASTAQPTTPITRPAPRRPVPERAKTGLAPGSPVAGRPTAATGGSPAPRRRVSAADNYVHRRAKRQSAAAAWFTSLIDDTPAWLISMVFHLVLLTLLALLTFPPEDDDRTITLNAMVSKDLKRAGQEEIENPADEIEFDLPVPEEMDLNDAQTRDAVLRADQEARELRIVDTADPQLPDLEQVKRQIGKTSGPGVALAARDPRVRVEMLKQEGGTTLTEAAVARGLRWLAAQQNADGSWRLDGGVRSHAAGTALAVLPFLGAGQTHLMGRYQDSVAQGLRWLVNHQGEDGDLRADAGGNSGMYAHGQAAIVLCEAYLMTGDDALRGPAQAAIDFIVDAQYADGGWRYKPNEEASAGERRSDTSVVGWQLMALQSARAAGLQVPDETYELVSHYLDSVQSHEGARYAYQTRNRATHVMTAEALLCRIYLGWTKDDPALSEGVQYLLDEHLPHANDTNMYYWYYGTQTMHHVGDTSWERWNFHMRDVLVSSQEKQGPHAGSWAPRGGHASAGGRLYMTALAVCTLEVYYRHLPIFRQIDVD